MTEGKRKIYINRKGRCWKQQEKALRKRATKTDRQRERERDDG